MMKSLNKTESQTPADPAMTQRLDEVRRWGRHSLAYTCLQPRLQYFEPEPGAGWIAWRRCWGVDLALGDPVCPKDRREALLADFIHKRRAAFAQIDETTSEILRSLKYTITPLGYENTVDLATFSLKGKKKADLRHYRNRAETAGLDVYEATDTPALRVWMHEVSKAWLQTKRIRWREMEFLERPLGMHPEPDVRIFIIRKPMIEPSEKPRGESHLPCQPIGFVCFDPVYEGGRVVGYTAAILRSLPESPEGTLALANLVAMEKFREEGCRELNLGLSPLHRLPELHTEYGAGARPLLWGCELLYTVGLIYNFKGLGFHKDRYRPQRLPRFVAGRSWIGWELASLWPACRVF